MKQHPLLTDCKLSAAKKLAIKTHDSESRGQEEAQQRDH